MNMLWKAIILLSKIFRSLLVTFLVKFTLNFLLKTVWSGLLTFRNEAPTITLYKMFLQPNWSLYLQNPRTSLEKWCEIRKALISWPISTLSRILFITTLKYFLTVFVNWNHLWHILTHFISKYIIIPRISIPTRSMRVKYLSFPLTCGIVPYISCKKVLKKYLLLGKKLKFGVF